MYMPIKSNHQSRISEINTLIGNIIKLENEINASAQSETTTAMIGALEELKQMIITVRQTYDGVYNGKPVGYSRKYTDLKPTPRIPDGRPPVFEKHLIYSTGTDVEDAVKQSQEDSNIYNLKLIPYVYVYKIQKGDTLSDLAKRYGTTVEEILKYNKNIKNQNKINTGSDLIIPLSLTLPVATGLINNGVNIAQFVENKSEKSSSDSAKNSSQKSQNTAKEPESTTTTSQTNSGRFSITEEGGKKVYQYDVKTQNQNEPKYKSADYFNYQEKGYGKSSISQSGCGPSSFATLINALNGKEITNPEEMCRYSLDHNARQHGAGTSMHDLMRAWCKEHPEYHYEQLYSSYSDPITKKAEALQKLYSALKEGKVAAIGNRPGYFTNNDHIVAVTGIEDNGGKIRLIISDPNYSEKNWNTVNGAELIGDKVYVEPEAAMKWIASIRLFYK